MGDARDLDSCERFIKEFNDDAVKGWPLDIPGIKKSYLAKIEAAPWIFMHYDIAEGDGEVHTLMLTAPFFYSAQDWDEDTISNVMEVFDMPREEALKRLKNCGLLLENYP